METLGHVRLQDETTGATLMVPKPSSDPNDPLNCHRSLPRISTRPHNPASLSPASISKFNSGISKAALLFSTTTVASGVSNLLWVPIGIKYGLRSVYFATFLAFGLCCIWSANASNFSSLLAARIVAAWFAGGAECLAPITIADITFLHERGRMTAMYSAALSTGAALGSLLSGVMSISQTWRVFHYFCAALVLFTAALILFTKPESAYHRIDQPAPPAETNEKLPNESNEERVEISTIPLAIPSKKSFVQRMAFNLSPLTQESIWKIAFRPVPLLVLPPVLWSTVSFGIGIGIFVILATTVATSFQQVYQFAIWQVGLVWISSIIGNFLGVPFGGYFSDWIANRATAKNGGVREPEMRLPAVSVAMIAYPGSLLLYGLGIHYKTHWMVPTLGVFLFSFGSSAAIGISVVYTIDCYRPIAGEIVVSQVVFKSFITFLMSFYANPWVQKDGYAGTFATMAAFSFVILALWIPLYIWGKQIRRATFKWRLMRYAHWDTDRETGE